MAVYVKLLLTALFWGGTFVAGRILARHMPPFAAAFLRFAVASACMLWFVRRHEGGMPRLQKSQILPAVLLGLTGVFAYNAFFFTGLKTVPAGRAAVIVALNPICISLFSALFFGEVLKKRNVLGVCLSVCGAILAVTHGRPLHILLDPISRGDLAILGCVASWTAYSLLGKRTMRTLTPHAAVTASCVFGALALLPFALGQGMAATISGYPFEAWASIVYLGFFGTALGFTWFYQGVKTLGAAKAAVFINFVPISAILLGLLFLGEPADLSLLLGAALVSTGAYLANK